MDSEYQPIKASDAIIEGEAATIVDTRSNIYPGERRQVLPLSGQHAQRDNVVLIKTAGNALQAISRTSLQPNTLVVHVPRYRKEGDELHVRTPQGSIISVTIPPGCFHGHAFLVKVPQEEENCKAKIIETPTVVLGVPVGNDSSATQPTSSEVSTAAVVTNDMELQANETLDKPQEEDSNGMILVKVPDGCGPGQVIRVSMADGSTMEATVPPGNVRQFYVRVPSSNSHDEVTVPVAVAKLV